jgi:uncharacterized protein with PQ loop repeat
VNRPFQIVVVSAIAVTLFVLLVYPAIISLNVRSTPSAKKLQLQQFLVLALMQLLFLPAAALLNEKLGFVEDLVSIAPADAQALTCTRRC